MVNERPRPNHCGVVPESGVLCLSSAPPPSRHLLLHLSGRLQGRRHAANAAGVPPHVPCTLYRCVAAFARLMPHVPHFPSPHSSGHPHLHSALRTHPPRSSPSSYPPLKPRLSGHGAELALISFSLELDRCKFLALVSSLLHRLDSTLNMSVGQ